MVTPKREAAATPNTPAPETIVRETTVRQIATELAQTFAFARSRWARYAEEVHPDLRGIGVMMLQIISRNGPMTATDIAHTLAMDKAMVSRQVTKLRALGLVEAEEDATDRRLVHLTATATACASLTGLHERTSAAYLARFQGWNDADLAELQRLLHRFNSEIPDQESPE